MCVISICGKSRWSSLSGSRPHTTRPKDCRFRERAHRSSDAGKIKIFFSFCCSSLYNCNYTILPDRCTVNTHDHLKGLLICGAVRDRMVSGFSFFFFFRRNCGAIGRRERKCTAGGILCVWGKMAIFFLSLSFSLHDERIIINFLIFLFAWRAFEELIRPT